MLIRRATIASALSLLAAACVGADTSRDPASEPLFPIDFQQTYLEMRDCRHSHEHELRFIRVFASQAAQDPYAALDPGVPYPVGAQLVKVEYDDAACESAIGTTAMEKLSPGDNPDGGDWRWQSVDGDRMVTEDGAPSRCVDCHQHHCRPPYGFDLTCAEEL